MNYYNSKEIVSVVNKIAEAKTKTSAINTFVLAILAGGYIAMGGLLAVVVGGGLPGLEASNPGIQKFLFGAVFPLGLILVAIAGADLFTGNTAYFIPSWFQGKTKFQSILKNWSIVYLGNFIGSIIVALCFAYLTDLFAKDPWLESIRGIAEAKTANPFYKSFLKGIACNWMVALAMWLSYGAKDISGKILGIWFPVMAFVAMGFEHSVANMFFIPTAIFYGADVTWTSFVVNNLIPVTLGNIVGGALFVGAAYWFVYERNNS
ncbi:formate/nitrite transporter family protein [Carboxylicivirga linearis]|uniref:Formate/nitrite transporter family protein n=1 Tax=Carboxylicivirga linearis TaxID=1628157 RepID=A0ABS5JRZ5_9BACT|nr:formate/nitrite transporter family protein [Carboxylicivirga linearis]MBS2097344.1 formate/nitrite transporter family protein [Carboxylicivirga linearis]